MEQRVKKTIKRLVTLAVLVLLAIWVAARWHVWFGNPPEESAAPLMSPAHVLLTPGDGDEMSRNISWQCDTVLHPSVLQLVREGYNDTVSIEAQGEVFVSRKGQAAYYVARLRNLEPCSHYRYRAITGDKASQWYGFQTHDRNSDRFSFLYVGDVQDTIKGKVNGLLRAALSRYPQCEFMVCAGDLTERPANQYWNETFNSLDSVGQSLPLLNVTGNHDYLKGVVQRLERRFALVFSYFLDSSVGDNMVYSMKYGNAQFFVLDSNREFPFLWTQRQWLKEQLEKSDAKWKILVLHHPLHSLKSKNHNMLLRWLFDSLVQEYGIDLVLQGHEHAYGRMATRGEDGKATTPVYLTSHCSPKNYTVKMYDGFDKIVPKGRFYQIVSAHGDTLSLAARDAESQVLCDSLLIVKNANSSHVIEPVAQ